MGITGKHVLKAFGPYRDIKVRSVSIDLWRSTSSTWLLALTIVCTDRFAGVVYPGETLVTEMWKEDNRVIFGTSAFLPPIFFPSLSIYNSGQSEGAWNHCACIGSCDIGGRVSQDKVVTSQFICLLAIHTYIVGQKNQILTTSREKAVPRIEDRLHRFSISLNSCTGNLSSVSLQSRNISALL